MDLRDSFKEGRSGFGLGNTLSGALTATSGSLPASPKPAAKRSGLATKTRIHHPAVSQKAIAAEMLEFLRASPLTSDLEASRNWDYLFHFEANRHLLTRKLVESAGLGNDGAFRILDFGYLTGLTQEFLHRAFPEAHLVVCDRPTSPIFSDSRYLDAIRSREYLSLRACDINDAVEIREQFQVITLGEIIEHLDPTQVAMAFENLRKLAAPGAVMIVTTPNASSLYNCYMTLKQQDAVTVPPIPNETHGYGHIHLWSPNVLRATAEHFGWKFHAIEFYHGRDGEAFASLNRRWESLSAQLVMRSIKLAGDCFPKLRSFFVAAFIAD